MRAFAHHKVGRDRRARRSVADSIPSLSTDGPAVRPYLKRPFATGAFLLAAWAAFGAGCASHGKSAKAKNEDVLLAPRHVEIGRIHSYDPIDKTAVIEFVPQYRATPFLAGSSLIARKLDTLAPTARLVAAPYQSGRMLGAYVTSGQPGVEDEVVIDPDAAKPDDKPAAKTGASTPAAPEPRNGDPSLR